MRIFIKEKKALAYYEKKASSDFWDMHWEINDLKTFIKSCTYSDLIIPRLQKFLPNEKGLILEGGCGRGNYVYCMQHNGYNAVGIDFARKTIEKIKQAVPKLDIRYGDVRSLPFKDNELAGYWSLGVIEHFKEGYTNIIDEMQRTIRPGGYLFLTVPYMSPLRRLKAFFGIYKKKVPDNLKDNFYQYALNHKHVILDFKNKGFTFCEKNPWDGIKGFKDECFLFKKTLQKIYDGKIKFRFTNGLNRFLEKFASHMILIVLRNDKKK